MALASSLEDRPPTPCHKKNTLEKNTKNVNPWLPWLALAVFELVPPSLRFGEVFGNGFNHLVSGLFQYGCCL